MVPPTSHKVPRVSWYSGSCLVLSDFGYGALTLSGRLSQNRSPVFLQSSRQSVTPACSHTGLGSFRFARRYSGNRCFFLFLRVLRCFSSPGYPRMTMDSSCGNAALPALSFLIRKSMGRSLFAAHHGLSQLIASFFGVWCLGIHPVLLLA